MKLLIPGILPATLFSFSEAAILTMNMQYACLPELACGPEIINIIPKAYKFTQIFLASNEVWTLDSGH